MSDVGVKSLRDSAHQGPKLQLRGPTHRDVNIKEKYLIIVNKDEVFVLSIREDTQRLKNVDKITAKCPASSMKITHEVPLHFIRDRLGRKLKNN